MDGYCVQRTILSFNDGGLRFLFSAFGWFAQATLWSASFRFFTRGGVAENFARSVEWKSAFRHVGIDGQSTYFSPQTIPVNRDDQGGVVKPSWTLFFFVSSYVTVNLILATALNYWIHILPLPIGQEIPKEVRLRFVKRTCFTGIISVALFACRFLKAKILGKLDDLCANHRVAGRGFQVHWSTYAIRVEGLSASRTARILF
jgi:hypothetical protein